LQGAPGHLMLEQLERVDFVAAQLGCGGAKQGRLQVDQLAGVGDGPAAGPLAVPLPVRGYEGFPAHH